LTARPAADVWRSRSDQSQARARWSSAGGQNKPNEVCVREKLSSAPARTQLQSGIEDCRHLFQTPLNIVSCVLAFLI
jgi:hypothetical protein